MAFPTGWGYKQKLTIQNSLVSTTLTDFPLLITRTELHDDVVDPSGSNNAQANGGDIRLSSDSAGTNQLPCEVVSFEHDTSTGADDAQIEVWVKVPSVSSSVDTDIYIWYNTSGSDTQPSVTDTYGRNAVWSEAILKVGFTSTGFIESTGGGLLSEQGTPPTYNAGGIFSGYATFSGAALPLTATDATIRDILTTYDTTVEVVARKASFISNDAAIGWSGTDDFTLYSHENDGTPTSGCRAFWRDVVDPASYINNVSVTGQFEFVSFTTRANNDHELYNDGVSGYTSTDTGAAGPFTDFNIGAFETNGNQLLDGDIASCTVWSSARTAGWIAAEYNNQNSPSTFIIDSAPEAIVGGATSELSSGSFALSGSNVDTRVDFVSPITSGTFSITGSTLDTLNNRLSKINSGAFALTGNNIDTLYDRLMVAESGAFLLTGSAIESLFNHVSPIDVGAFNITGSAITTTYDSLAPTISIESGSFALTGSNINTLVNHVSSVVSGVFNIAGSSIDTSVSLVTDIETGAFILTGSNLQSLYDRLTVLESGAFVLDGSDISTAITGVGVDVIIDIQLIHDISNKIRLDCATSAISLKRVQND